MSNGREIENRDIGALTDKLFALPRIQLLSVLLLFSAMVFPKLGNNGMAVWDDGYYAQKAKEILTNGNLLTMHYNSRPTFDNPPMFMWLQALSYRVWGITEYAAKFPSAIFGTLAILLTYLLGSEMRDKNYGLLAALVLSLSQPFIRYSRRGMIDVTLAFFVLLALYFSWMGSKGNKKWFYLWAASCGISVLLKSVLGVFPIVIVILWLIINKRYDVLSSGEFIISLLLAVFCFGWWYLYEIIRWGKPFLDLHFGWLIWTRGFIRQEDSGHWWEHLSYLKDLLKYYWPWLPLAVWGGAAGFRHISNADEKKHFSLLLVWIISYILVLSLLEARRVWYIMPVFPGLAFLAASSIQSWIKGIDPYPRIAKYVFLLFMLVLMTISYTPLRIDKARSEEVRLVSPYVRYYSNNGARLLAYKLDYYGLNNALLFYSDRGADICRDQEVLRQMASQQPTATCLVESKDYQEWSNDIKAMFKLVKRAGPLLYLTTGPMLPDTLQVSSNTWMK